MIRFKIEALLERERERVNGFRHKYNDIISCENLLVSWREFLRGKRKRKDVEEFSVNFIDNINFLHQELADGTYNHGGYCAFKINDPKQRDIHKASVRDRLVHHAIHRILYPHFDNKFIYHSYSSRLSKGTHRAIYRFLKFYRKVSKNNTQICWILKCDIKKFFDNIDHEILLDILKKNIADPDIICLLERIIYSFSKTSGKGLPLGNLTSQLFVNIYMNEFDQFVKRYLKARYYIRFADDFVILSPDKSWLDELIFKIADFLSENLKLELHPGKISIRTIASGVDFLGWVNFPEFRVLRTVTRRRMLKRIKINKPESLNSYLGLLKHGSTHKIKKGLSLDQK